MALSTYGFDVGDKVVTGDIFRIHNRAWQAVHVAMVVWGVVEMLGSARHGSGGQADDVVDRQRSFDS